MSQTISEVARVEVSPETLAEVQKPLSQNQKQKLRREAIISYIKSRPYGSRIKLLEFQAVGDFTTHAYTDIFIKKMLSKKLITREEIGWKKYAYAVPGQNGEVKTTTPPRPTATEQPMPDDIEQKAMKFSWDHVEDHNDLRKFIAWLKNNR